MGRFDRFCQSCGMPLSMDPKGGGTETDGSRNDIYCSHCYRNGGFTDDFVSPKQMVRRVREILKGQGVGPVRRWFYTSHISRLGRWRP